MSLVMKTGVCVCVCVYTLCRYILVYVCFCNMFGLLGHNNFMVYSPQFSQQLL